jgi:hypothetical protein
MGKEFAHERDIRPPGELEAFSAIVDAKFRGESAGERLRAGPAGVNERAVNIE